MGPQDNRSIMPCIRTAGQIDAKTAAGLPRAPSRGLTRDMRVTKHEHAALTIRDSGKTLIVDPGSFTDPLPDDGDVVAIVLTHEHPDHWTPEHLRRILSNAPKAQIIGPQGLADAAAEAVLLQSGDGFDASRVLLLQDQDGLLVSVPDRDVLWAAPEQGQDVEALIDKTADLAERATHPVSEKLFRITGGQLQTVQAQE